MSTTTALSIFISRCIGYALAVLAHSWKEYSGSHLQGLTLGIFEQMLLSKIATQRIVAGLVLALWADFDKVIHEY